MSSQPKLSSRLSSLNMFGKFAASKPPPPIEKDPWYQMAGSKSAVSLAPSQALSMHTSSVASMSVETLQLPQTPLSTVTAAQSQYDLSRTMSPVSARSRATTMTAQSKASEMSSFRRGISKISNFGKKSKLFLRSNASRATLGMDGMRSSDEAVSDELDGDEGISRPWNVQHHLHVDEGLENLPSEWMNKLREQGLKDTEILSIHSRRNRTTYLKNHPDVSVDIIRAGSQSSCTPTSTSAPSNALLPLPKSALPKRSTSLRRPQTHESDNTSLTTSGRSGGSRLSPDSTSPPSSYSFASSGVPSDSSVSSRAPSLYADGDSSDDYSDPGTATASRFGASVSAHLPTTSVSALRGLPRIDIEDGDPPAHTSPNRPATLTFVVTNPTPPSPPPAYDHSEHGNASAHGFPRDEKHDPNTSNLSNSNRRASSSSVQQAERRSEETLTPEVLLRNGNGQTQTNCVPPSNEASQQSHSPTLRLHLTKPSRDESASSLPPESPFTRTFSEPPRLSLPQDDLDSWSASLFSAMSTPDSTLGSFAGAQSLSTSTSASVSKPTVDTAVAPATPAKGMSPKTKKASIPPLVISPPSGIPRVTIETDDDDSAETGSETVEYGAGTSTTPLFNEVLSLVKANGSTTPNYSPPLTSTYPYLPPAPSPRQSSPTNSAQAAPSQSPNQTYEFLNESYDTHRESTISSSAGSRESQMTISTSSRWSKTTTIRDIRDATISVAHVRKPSVANAVTVPAPFPNRHAPQPGMSTAQSGGSGGDGSRPLSQASPDSAFLPSAADFPLPPPSTGDFSVSSVLPSPMSGKFSVMSDDVKLPYTVVDSASVDRVSSPASTRSSQSSEGTGSSSSSSQVNPLSVTSASDEGPEQHGEDAVHIELRCSEGNILSPTESTMSELDAAKWTADQKKLSPPPHISIAGRTYASSTDDSEDTQDRDGCCKQLSALSDGASAVVEWLTESPSPHFDPNEKPLRESGTLYSLVGEPTPRKDPILADSESQGSPQSPTKRPTLQINGIATLCIPGNPDKPPPRLSPASLDPSPSSATPSPSPLQRYRGWVSEVVAPIEEFIDHTVDPRELFIDLVEIAEGESGSVFSATVAVPSSPKAKSYTRMKEIEKRGGKVAVKQVPLVPDGSPKLEDLRKELMLMSRVSHVHILSMDALYVDLVDDALWIEMEFMERSLADVLALAGEGLVLEEKVIARFTCDILSALAHLEPLGIVHRDVRSDNLLVNGQGVLKLADFSNGLLVDPAYPIRTDSTGVIYWQAPEMRNGSYDARKVDIWSAGATAWEMAESEPPFMSMNITDPRQLPERWPALSQSDNYSRSFHDFLTLCSNPSSSRPSAHDLLMTPFIRSSCARSLIVDILTQCKSIEARIVRRTSGDSQGTILP